MVKAFCKGCVDICVTIYKYRNSVGKWNFNKWTIPFIKINLHVWIPYLLYRRWKAQWPCLETRSDSRRCHRWDCTTLLFKVQRIIQTKVSIIEVSIKVFVFTFQFDQDATVVSHFLGLILFIMWKRFCAEAEFLAISYCVNIILG